MTFRDHFSAYAKQYALHRPGYPDELFDYLASIAPKNQRAWDCGTGNGQAALQLAARFQRVIATDASREQIENAFPHEKVEYRVERAENTTIDTGAVDLVAVGVAVHWFDLGTFYQEVRRVGAPGSVLAVWTYHLPRIDPDVDRIAERYYRDLLTGYFPDRFHYVDARYQTLPFPFEELDPPPFTMEAAWNLDQFLGFLASWSAAGRYLEREGHHPLETVLDDLRVRWGERTRQRTVQWSMHMRVGRIA